MVRKAREKSPTGFYHVCVRGDGGRVIFDCPDDYLSFMDTLSASFQKHGIRLGAWCLMSNHAHLLVDDSNDYLGPAMQSLMTSYARRFNKRTGHKGHVFQDRYWSSPIKSNLYLEQVIKYIHLNPQKAGISRFDTYRWSSYREYMGQEGYIDQDISCGIFGSPSEFKEYMADSRPLDYRPSWRMRISDNDVLPAGEALLRSQFGISRHEVQELPKGRRCEVICTLRDEGFSTNQIQLLTGLGEWVIKKARHTA